MNHFEARKEDIQMKPRKPGFGKPLHGVVYK